MPLIFVSRLDPLCGAAALHVVASVDVVVGDGNNHDNSARERQTKGTPCSLASRTYSQREGRSEHPHDRDNRGMR